MALEAVIDVRKRHSSMTKIKNSNEAPRPGRKRIFLVEDHPILRQGFAELLNRHAEFLVCGQAEDVPGALAQLAEANPDLLVLDIELKDSNGLDLLQQSKSLFPSLRVLILSMHDETVLAERAIRAGADGYVMKHSPVDEIIGAMRRVAQGERYLSPRMRQRLEHVFNGVNDPLKTSGLARLSERELQVFQLIGQGIKTREIAAQLKLSVKTVETYRAHLIEKLQLQDGLELIRYAIQTVNAGSSNP
jgi:DNA-binding NarL/FixJ family response regulator